MNDLTIQEKKELAELTNIIDELLTFSEFKQAINNDWANPKYFTKPDFFIKGEGNKKRKIILRYLQTLFAEDKELDFLDGLFKKRIESLIAYAIQSHKINNKPIAQEKYMEIKGLLARLGMSIQDIYFGKNDGVESKNSKYNKLFDEMNLHPKIKQVSEELFKDGYYAQAILEAFKAVTNFVKENKEVINFVKVEKEKTGKDLDGAALMTGVFSKNNPIIKLNNLQESWEKDEQEGFMHLYTGATLGIRNPKAHAYIVQKDPCKTLKFLSLASLLIEKIDDFGNVS